MIPANEAAAIFGLSGHRLKQILREENIECPRKGGRGEVYLTPEIVRNLISKRNNQRYKPTVGTLGIQKGGTGKSSITLMVALAGARKGCKIAIVDLDPEACATGYLMPEDFSFEKNKTILEVFRQDLNLIDCMVKSRFPGIDFLPSRSKSRRIEREILGKNPKTLLRKKMTGMLDAYDLVLFDIPPSFSTLVSSAYLTSDLVVMPCTPSIFDLESIALTIEDIQETCTQFECKVPEIRILRNRFAAQRRNSKETLMELKEHQEALLPFYIKSSAAIENAINDGVSLFDTKGNADLKSVFTELFDYICPLEVIA